MPYPPEFLDRARTRIQADPFFLAAVLGFEGEWFHKAWLAWALSHPKHVIEAPRGFGKSTICTTLLAIWRIVRDPNVRILIVSKTETQASRFLREIRGHLEENTLLHACFGEFVGTGKWTDKALVVSQRKEIHKEATVTAVGLEGPIIGGHWDLILIDDPFDEESSRSELLRDRAFDWLFVTLMPTLLPGGTIGVRCTRYHYGDLAGRIERDLATDQKTGESHVYRLESEDDFVPAPPRDPRWKVLQVPAVLRDGSSLWETRFPLEDRVNPDGTVVEGLKSLRADMGERRFGQQFQMVCPEQSSFDEESEFKREWFRSWVKAPDRSRLVVFQYVDPAFRDREQAARRTKRDRDPDFYAIGVVGFDYAAGRTYVLDAFRDRLTPVERESKAKEYADRWRPALVEVERTGLQQREAPAFYQAILRALAPHRARFGQPRRDKVARAQPLARAMDRGVVEWNPAIFDRYPALIDEFARFPFAEHDDFVDAVSGAFLLGERRPRSLGAHLRQVFRRIVGGSDSAIEARSARIAGSTGPSSRAVPPVSRSSPSARSVPRSW